MSKIDRRIVEMEFENKSFEERIRESANSLKDFDKALKDAGSGAGGLSALGGIAAGVGGQFTALGAIAFGALSRIGSMAIETGITIVKALTLDQVLDGFVEYELKMNAIRVMMASGKTAEGLDVTLEQVNDHLEKLNLYADRTIYSFKDMTQTIGQFTNAGVNVELAVDAIMGITNQAALAGASTQEAASSMNAFATSLAFGHVALRQWRSIEINKMGTVEFKQQLIDTAVAMGTLEKRSDGLYNVLTAGATKAKMGNVISATKEFSYSLHNQWLTADVLTKTLERYNDETTEIGKKAREAAETIRTFSMLKANITEAIASGWGVTFERLIGDFDESSELFTMVASSLEKMILKSNDSRNDLLQEWKDLGGRDDVILGFRRGWNTLLLILRQAKKAFAEVFPPATAETLKRMSEGFLKFMSSLAVSGKNVGKIGEVFRNVFRGLELIGLNFANIFKAVGQAFGAVFSGPTLEQLVALTAGWRSFMWDLTLSRKTIGYLKTIFEGLFSAISLAGQFIFAVFKGLYDGLKSVIDLIPPGKNGGILGFLAGLATWLINLKDAAKNGEVFAKISETIANAIRWVAEGIQSAIIWITNFVQAVRTWFKESDKVKALITTLGEIFDWIKEKISGLITKIKESTIISDILGWVSSLIEKFFSIFETSGDTSGLSDTTGKIGSTFTKVKEILEPIIEWLSETWTKLKTWFSETFGISSLDDLLTYVKIFATGGIASGLMKFTGSLTGFVKSVKAIPESFKGFRNGALGIMSEFKNTLRSYQDSLNSKKLLTIAGAIALLVLSLVVITMMDAEQLARATLVITALFLNLANSMQLMSQVKGGSKKAIVSLILIAGAVFILSAAMLFLKNVGWEEMAALSVLLGVVIGAARVLSTLPDVKKGTVSLLGMTWAVRNLAMTVMMLGFMKPEQLIKGVAAVMMLVGIAILFAFGMSELARNEGSMLAGAAALLIMSFAMLQLAGVVALLGKLNVEQLSNGLAGLAGILIIMAVGLTALANPQVLFGAAAMLIMSYAIALFVPALLALGSVPLLTLGIALGAIAAMFILLGIAGYALAPVIPVVIGVAAAVALLGLSVFLIGAAVLAAGTGVFMFAAGLVLLGIAGPIAISLLVLVIKELVALLPFLIDAFGKAIVALAGVIRDGVPAIMEAFVAIVIGMLEAWGQLIPSILEIVGKLITALLDFLVEKVPEIYEATFEIISKLLALLVDRVPEFVDAGMKIILGFLTGIGDNIQEVVEAAYNIVINLLNGIAEKLPELITAGADIVLAYVEGMTTEIPRVVDTAFELVIEFINGLADSIRENTPLILEACKSLATAFIDGVKEYLNIEEGKTIAGHIIQGLINGITGGIDSVVAAVTELGLRILGSLVGLFKFDSPSKVTTEMGMFIDLGFVKGITKYAPTVIKAIKNLGTDSLSALHLMKDRISDVLDSDLNMSPVITPVLNLNNLKSGVNTLDSMLASGKSYGLAALKISHDKDLARSNQNGSNPLKEQLTTIHNEFNLNGITIRSEADIEKLAQELYNKQENAMRSRGIRPSYVH